MLRSEGEQPLLTVRRASPQGASHEGGGAPATLSPQLPPSAVSSHSRSAARPGPATGCSACRTCPGPGALDGAHPSLERGGGQGWWAQQGPIGGCCKVTQRGWCHSTWPADPGHPGHCTSPCDAHGRGPEGNPNPESHCRLCRVAPCSPWGHPHTQCTLGPFPVRLLSSCLPLPRWQPHGRARGGGRMGPRDLSSLPTGPGAERGGSCGPRAGTALRVPVSSRESGCPRPLACHGVHRGAQSPGGARSPGAALDPTPPRHVSDVLQSRALPHPTQLPGFPRAAAPLAPG